MEKQKQPKTPFEIIGACETKGELYDFISKELSDSEFNHLIQNFDGEKPSRDEYIQFLDDIIERRKNRHTIYAIPYTFFGLIEKVEELSLISLQRDIDNVNNAHDLSDFLVNLSDRDIENITQDISIREKNFTLNDFRELIILAIEGEKPLTDISEHFRFREKIIEIKLKHDISNIENVSDLSDFLDKLSDTEASTLCSNIDLTDRKNPTKNDIHHLIKGVIKGLYPINSLHDNFGFRDKIKEIYSLKEEAGDFFVNPKADQPREQELAKIDYEAEQKIRIRERLNNAKNPYPEASKPNIRVVKSSTAEEKAKAKEKEKSGLFKKIGKLIRWFRS